jgi:hypothetical protein
MALSDLDLANIVVKSRPTNYGVNQINVGVANSTGSSTIRTYDYTYMFVTRGTNGNAYEDHLNITVATGASGVITYTTSAAHNLTVGQTVFVQNVNSGFLSVLNVYGGTAVTSTPSSTQFIVTSPDPASSNGVSGTGGDAMCFRNGDVIWISPFAVAYGVPTPTDSLGVNASYHIFDTGSTTATSTNPGYGVTGTSTTQGLEAYYSLFVIDSVGSTSSRKIRDFSQVFTKDYGWYRSTDRDSNYGKLLYDKNRSTTQWMLNNLPDIYKTNSRNAYNTDLEKFISLFAFHYDTYRTAADLVFSRTSSKQIDKKLLDLFLRELGFNPARLNNDVFLNRKLLRNIIRLYQNKGSTFGIGLATELFTGYNAAVATSETNLIPDLNAASSIEGPRVSPYWRVSPTISSTPAVTLSRVGRHFVGTSASNLQTAYSDNGALQVKTTATQTVEVQSSIRYVVTSADVSAGATVIPVIYSSARPNDYVINDPTNGTPFVPIGAYVSAIPSNNSNITLSSPVSGGTILAGTTLYVSGAGPDIVSAASKMVPVTALSTYSYSFYANAGGFTMTNVTAVIYWHKLDGSYTSADASRYFNLGSVTTNASNTTWFRVSVTATAPSDAVYAAPAVRVTLGGTTTNNTFFFDAFQVEQAAAPTTYTDPAITAITATAVSAIKPFNSVALSAAEVALKDYLTTGFVPLNLPTSQSYTVYSVSDTSRTMLLPNPITGGNNNYPVATVILRTGTNNITVGQSFSLGATASDLGAVNLVSSGLITGVISSTTYRVVRRDSTSSDFLSTSVSPSLAAIQNNFYVGTVNKSTVATASV